MEQISNIASRQVNFKSQTKTQTSPIEAVKEKFNNMEDNEKITVGLSALGVLALASLAIAKRPHKVVETAQEVVNEITQEKPIQQVVENADEIIEEVAPKIYPHVDIAHQPKIEKQQETIAQGVERAIKATQEYVQGGNFGEVKSNATRNLGHDGKKVVQGTLDKVHSAKVAQDITNEHQLANMANSATSSATATKNVRQGMKNATREQIVEKLDEAYDSAYQAQVNAQQAQVKAQEIGTKKAHKAAFRADKAAQRAEIEADTARYNAYWRNLELAQEQAQKEANVAEQMASQNYKSGLEKKAQSEKQTTINSAKRQVSALKNRPEYKRTLQKFQRNKYSGDKLLKIMDNPNSSEIEKLVAQELLETITK